MPVTVDELAARYPILFHMAAVGSWPSIARHGLLSTSELLDLFEVKGGARSEIEERHRPEPITIHHPERGIAVIRDQRPMDDRGLVRALRDGLQPSDWYRILNGKVFFWVQRSRLERMMRAMAYRRDSKIVLYVETTALLERHASRVLLAPINTGCTKPRAYPRGLDTFQPLADYPYRERRRRRLEAVVELAVEHRVPDIRDLVLRVEEVTADGISTVLFQR